jgi:hypothetical protein
VLEPEQGAVAGPDDDRGKREFGEPLQLEGEAAVRERGGEVVEALRSTAASSRPSAAWMAQSPAVTAARIVSAPWVAKR